ncbi:MAG: hypothetical protein WB973_09690, partial [Thermoanaerobaculia bacterium]
GHFSSKRISCSSDGTRQYESDHKCVPSRSSEATSATDPAEPRSHLDFAQVVAGFGALKELAHDGYRKNDLLNTADWGRRLSIVAYEVDRSVSIQCKPFAHFLTGSMGNASSMARPKLSASSPVKMFSRCAHGFFGFARSTLIELFSRWSVGVALSYSAFKTLLIRTSVYANR